MTQLLAIEAGNAAAALGAEFWRVLGEMAPYLILGFLLAGALAVGIPKRWVERHLGRPGFASILKAVVMGIPLPLCSCGVIPVAASLRRHGAGRGPATAFLLATPQTGVDSLFVTFSLLGPVFTLFRAGTALVSGVIAGVATDVLGGDAGTTGAAPGCTDSCCSAKPEKGRVRRALEYALLTLPADLGPALLLGLAVAAVIGFLVPDESLAPLLGAGFLGLLLMMAAGIPVYVCATASVPIAAALMAKGASPGAALVFLMTGPATNAAAVTSLWKVLGRRSALVYLASVAVTALASGALLDAVFTSASLPVVAEVHEMLPGAVKNVSAAALLVLLAGSLLWQRFRGGHGHHVEAGGPIVLRIAGMRCAVCAATVAGVLEAVPGVASVTVDGATDSVTVEGDHLDGDALSEAVRRKGFHPESGDPSCSCSGEEACCSLPTEPDCHHR